VEEIKLTTKEEQITRLIVALEPRKIQIEIDRIDYDKGRNSEGEVTTGLVYGNVSNAATNYGQDRFAANNKGHGFAAERANHLYDKFTGKKVEILGDDNAKQFLFAYKVCYENMAEICLYPIWEF